MDDNGLPYWAPNPEGNEFPFGSPSLPETDDTILDTFDFDAFLQLPVEELQSSSNNNTTLPNTGTPDKYNPLAMAHPQQSSWGCPEDLALSPSPLHTQTLSNQITYTEAPRESEDPIFLQGVAPPDIYGVNEWLPEPDELALSEPDDHALSENDEEQVGPRIGKVSGVPKYSCRTKNIANFDPSLFYKPLASPPSSWSSPQPFGTIFEYTAQGELNPNIKYSRNEICNYLTYHPQHTFYGPSPSTKHSGLTLWIQNTPADAANRYPTPQSSKCRFSNCPVPNNTIRKGEFRVAFDEQSCFNAGLDPYHNAGYVHLFCLEKTFDFPRMCKLFDVRGDDRSFPEGRNRMAISRDSAAMAVLVKRFIRDSRVWEEPRPEGWYEQSLCYQLTMCYLSYQPRKRQRVRNARGGNSVDRHLNNLDVMVENARAIRERRAREPMRKRKRPAGNEEESILDDNILDDDMVRPSTRVKFTSNGAQRSGYQEHMPGLPY